MLDVLTRNIGGEQVTTHLTAEMRIDALEEAYHTVAFDCELGLRYTQVDIALVANFLVLSPAPSYIKLLSVTHKGCPVQKISIEDAYKFDSGFGTSGAAQGDNVLYYTEKPIVGDPFVKTDGATVFLPIPRDNADFKVLIKFISTPTSLRQINGEADLNAVLWDGYYDHTAARRAVETKMTQIIYERMGDRVNFGDARYWRAEYEEALYKFKRQLFRMRTAPSVLVMGQ